MELHGPSLDLILALFLSGLALNTGERVINYIFTFV